MISWLGSRCWLGHRWSFWEVWEDEGVFVTETIGSVTIGPRGTLHRFCRRCGKREFRKFGF